MQQAAGKRDKDGFLLRGEEVSRIEAFVDASFAFAMTLLVIFYNDLPDTVAELRQALLRVPTFVVCFVLLGMFWLAHNRWSRRFGLENAYTTTLSLALVLVVLVFVYPLRMVISAFLGTITVLLYFFFSKAHTGVYGKFVSIGKWFMMVGFGASFGLTVMARISLLIGRIQFLVNDVFAKIF